MQTTNFLKKNKKKMSDVFHWWQNHSRVVLEQFRVAPGLFLFFTGNRAVTEQFWSNFRVFCWSVLSNGSGAI